MLQRQRDGVTADLDKIYPQVVGERNGWLGGDGDQRESGPYWIDGLLPMAFSIKRQRIYNSRSSHSSGGKFYPVELIPYGCTTLRISEFPLVTR